MDKSELGAVKARTAVIIATKNRPQEVSNLLDALAVQTVLPDVIVVSACDSNDIKHSRSDTLTVQTVFGAAGLAAQRNRALAVILRKM